MRFSALPLALLLLAGCSSTRRVETWERLAGAAAIADAASSLGGREGNPLYGSHAARPAAILAGNGVLHALIRAALNGAPETERRATWRAIAIARFAVVAWNLRERMLHGF